MELNFLLELQIGNVLLKVTYCNCHKIFVTKSLSQDLCHMIFCHMYPCCPDINKPYNIVNQGRTNKWNGSNVLEALIQLSKALKSLLCTLVSSIS